MVVSNREFPFPGAPLIFRGLKMLVSGMAVSIAVSQGNLPRPHYFESCILVWGLSGCQHGKTWLPWTLNDQLQTVPTKRVDWSNVSIMLIWLGHCILWMFKMFTYADWWRIQWGFLVIHQQYPDKNRSVDPTCSWQVDRLNPDNP